MRKKIGLFTVAYIVASLFLMLYCWQLSLLMLVVLALLGFSGISLIFLNKVYKHTNHWKNQFQFQKQFISNAGYRDNINRNFDIVNLGSNPALYGFFYEDIHGQNWATGSQGLPMDFEILKYFHSYIKEGGYVLIPIMPFTSISQYIKNKKEYWGLEYYAKFASILDYAQVRELPYGNKILKYLRYPLLFNFKLVRYILRDVSANTTLSISEQPLMALDLEQDADRWILGWKKEFDVKSMDDFMSTRFDQYIEEAAEILRQMVDFCIERSLKPIFITVPMSSYLAKRFPTRFRKQMIIDFINKANVNNIPVLNYMFDETFSNSSMYKDSFMLNLRGRKLFTQRVLKDLKLI